MEHGRRLCGQPLRVDGAFACGPFSGAGHQEGRPGDRKGACSRPAGRSSRCHSCTRRSMAGAKHDVPGSVHSEGQAGWQMVVAPPEGRRGHFTAGLGGVLDRVRVGLLAFLDRPQAEGSVVLDVPARWGRLRGLLLPGGKGRCGLATPFRREALGAERLALGALQFRHVDRWTFRQVGPARCPASSRLPGQGFSGGHVPIAGPGRVHPDA